MGRKELVDLFNKIEDGEEVNEEQVAEVSKDMSPDEVNAAITESNEKSR